jgi:hypothetical protein
LTAPINDEADRERGGDRLDPDQQEKTIVGANRHIPHLWGIREAESFLHERGRVN